MALLAGILIHLVRTAPDRHTDSSGWTAAVFAALAMIVVGSAMPLRPIEVSYLFLAVTLWLLETRLSATSPRSLTSWWPLPLLFALWANLDAWFLLGPLTVGLYLFGTLLSGGGRSGQVKSLAIVFLAGLGACLLNPHHVHIFALPPLAAFTPEATILHDDPIFSRLRQSPFQIDSLHFRTIPHLGLWLYFVLVVLGPVSFLFNGLAARSREDGAASACVRRLPVWLAFFALSAFDVSTLPFMAIVAAPLTALNFQEYQRRRQALRSAVLPPHRLRPLGGRVLTLLLLVVLGVAAWPGWLQGQLREPRGWEIETDVSLVEGVRQAARWRREGRIAARETGFNFSPTAAHYAAWFAPEEKGFWDSRWRLFASGDYVTVRRALLGDRSVLDAARRILRTHHVTHLLLHDSDPAWTAGVFQRLLLAPAEWPILFLQGDTVMAGWRDPASGTGETPVGGEELDRFADCRVDFDRRAFQPTPQERAPAQGPAPQPQGFNWLSFVRPVACRQTHAGDEAALYLIWFESLRPVFQARQRAIWESSLATGVWACGTPSLASLARQLLDGALLQSSQGGSRPPAERQVGPIDALSLHLVQSFRRTQDDGPPGLLLLAVRAARRAVRDDPHDGHAYRLLGDAYRQLARSTRERGWRRSWPSQAHLRQLQTAVALHQALHLSADLLQTHAALYELYQDMKLLDLALQHLREVQQLMRRQASASGGSPETEAQRIRRTDQLVDALAQQVQERQNQFEHQAARLSVLNQAILALDLGLGRKALDILLASDVAAFGKRGTEIELNLLLTVGRLHEAREWLTPEFEVELGAESYHRLRILLAAANGDYEPADAELDQVTTNLQRPVQVIFDLWKILPAPDFPAPAPEQPRNAQTVQVSPRQAVCLELAQFLLSASPPQRTPLDLLQSDLQRQQFLQHVQEFAAGNLLQQANSEVFRGMLTLEYGTVEDAKRFLHRALSIWLSAEETASGGSLDFPARPAAQDMLEWMAEPRP